MALEVYCPKCEKSYQIDNSNTQVEKEGKGIKSRYNIWSFCPWCKERSGAQILTEESQRRLKHLP